MSFLGAVASPFKSAWHSYENAFNNSQPIKALKTVSGPAPGKPHGTSGLTYSAAPAPSTYDTVSTIDPYASGNVGTWGLGSQGSGGSGGGTGAVAPPVDPLAGLRQQATDRIHSILSAYDSLFGGIDNTAKDQANRLNSDYDLQTQNLNKAFENGQGATGSAYAARGLGQSSFLGDALGQNADVYNQNNQQLVNDRNTSLSSLGQQVATQKAQLNAGKDQYNSILGQLGDYGQSDLQSLIPSLQSAYGGLQTQQAGLGSQGDFINSLNAITPVQNHGVDQLSSKLQALIQSGAPKFAKNQLASGLIKQAGINDPSQQSYWTNYYNQLLGA